MTSRRNRFVLVSLAAALRLLLATPVQAQGVLSVEIVNGYNLIVDSNVTAPSTYAPSAAYIGAQVCNTGNAALSNVTAYVGNYDAGRSFSVTRTAGGTTLTSAGLFTASDAGLRISGTGIPAGTTITGFTSTSSVTISQAATSSGTASATVAAAAGVFPVTTFGTDLTKPHLSGTGNYSLTLETGTGNISDATRYVGTLAAGECRIEYWLFSYPQCVNVSGAQQYPPCDVSIAGGVKPDDDLSLAYDVWATADSAATASQTNDFTMRNEISASANKIWPNTDSKVPNEYLAAIEGILGWGTLGPDGQPLSSSSAVYPGQRVITTQGIWYDLGNVVHGFDNNLDLLVDQNAWLQPVGDPSSFDSGCFRMVNVYGIVIVKLKTGGELLIPFRNQLYHENLPDNTGVVGLVYYQYIATKEGCSANMTPYQEAASGYDNEKFSADYGLNLPLASNSFGADLSFTKTDGQTSVTTGSTLTYTISATNSTGVHLGAPDLGTPLVFSDAIPTGTTFVAGSADDSPSTNLVQPTGSGTYQQGFTDKDGELDECTIGYQVSSSSWVVFYSTDNGLSWTLTEPAAASVTNLRWMLLTTLALDGGHDRTDCVAPNGSYDNGTTETSLPGGSVVTGTPISIAASFQVTVNSTGGPVICNTARFGFGPALSNTEAQDCTLISGPNSIRGTVFEDDAGTGGTFGNGTIDNATEVGIGGGAIVTLYYDQNGDGLYDSGDLQYATTTTSAMRTASISVTTTNASTTVTSASLFTAADVGSRIWGTGIPSGAVITAFNSASSVTISSAATASGTVTASLNRGAYSFTGLPDGNYIVVLKKYDGTAAGNGSIDAVNDFLATRDDPLTNADTTSGWGNTTWDPNLPLTTDSGILKLNEDLTTASLAISVDLDHSNGVDQSATTTALNRVDFGFAPPLVVTKTVPTATVDEGEVFNYTILVQNRLPAAGVQGPTGCQYTVWATDGTNGTPAGKAFTDPGNAWDGPNNRVATALVTGGGLRNVTSTGFRLADQLGNIVKVEALVLGYYNVPLTDDNLTIATTLGGSTETTTIGTAAIDSYVGAPADLGPDSAISWDMTSLRPGGGTWSWADDFFAVSVNVNPSKATSADQKTFELDAVGLRVSTDADCVAGPSTTLSPVPLRDRFDTTNLNFVSATPTPTSVSGGTILWNDVGPILPGSSKVIRVSMRPKDVDGLLSGTCAATSAPSTPPPANSNCNLVEAGYGGADVYYQDGRKANNDDDKVPVNIQGKAELRGTLWSDLNNNGWPIEAEPGLASVPVSLFACVTSDKVTLETGDGTSKTCSTLTSGNTWMVVRTTTTDTSGNYEFLGLDSGYYIIQVGDTDGVVTTAGTSPYGKTQTGEPLDTQTSASGNANGNDCSPLAGGVTCDNTWGSSTVFLRSDQTTINFLNGATEETVNGINFGYYSANGSIFGNTWHDVDGDSTRDSGEGNLDDFTVRLYTDAGGGTLGSLLQTTTTDSSGNYFFNALSAGNYIVVVTPEVLPNNVWSETVEQPATGGTAGALDNRILVTLSLSSPTYGLSGSHDFGYTLSSTSTIGDTVYLDFDGDGIQDSTEAGIPSITVWLYSDVDRDGTIDAGVDELLQTDVTDGSGEYLFTGLPEGSYVVKVDTSDPDFPSEVTATADPDVNTGTIGDFVWLDANGNGAQDSGENGIPGVVALLWADSDGNGSFSSSLDTLIQATTTNVNGNYLFTTLPAGGYFVSLDEATLPSSALVRTTPAAANSSLITLASNSASNLTADFGYSPSSDFAIGNRVWHDQDGDGVQDSGEVGLPGVDITVTGGSCSPSCTATTDAAGFWIITGLTNATYSVALDDTDLPRDFIATTGTTDPRSVTVSGADNMGVDFGYRYDPTKITASNPSPTGTISGNVFRDANGNGTRDAGEQLESTTVNLLDENGNIIATATTAVTTGAYSFPGAIIGDYTVEVLSTYGTRYSTLFLASTSGFPNLNVVYDATLSNTPDDQSSVSVDGVHDNLMQDFGYHRFLGSIGDTVYWDVNENGTQDPGEPGFPSVTVRLYDCLWTDDGDGMFESGEQNTCGAALTTTTTADDPLTAADEGGKYLFSNLPALATSHYYIVQVDTSTLPGVLNSTLELIGDPETDGTPCPVLPVPDVDGDEYPPPGVCDSYNLVQVFRGGLNYLGADFGYQVSTVTGYGRFGDHVWLDADGDGVVDPGEPGIPDVTVWVDSNNDGVLDGPKTISVGTTNTSTTVTSSGLFTAADVGRSISGSGIPSGATITGFTNANTVTISAAATATGSVVASLGPRTFSVGTSSGSTTVSSSGAFSSADVGRLISGTGIPAGAYITAFGSASSVTISSAATATGTVTGSVEERTAETDSDGYYLFTGLPDGSYRTRVFTSDGDWPSGLSTTPTFEVRTTNTASRDNLAVATISGGAVTSIDDGDGTTTDTCSDCDLDVDFGYRYTGTNSLSGSICMDDTGNDGICGAATRTATVGTTNASTTVTSAGQFTAADVGRQIYGTGIPAGATITGYTNTNTVTISAAATATGSITATIGVHSGVTAGSESPLAGIAVYLYRWTDGNANNLAWNATTFVTDAADTFSLIGSTSTDANGDYSFTNVPDNVVVLFGVQESQNLDLTTTGSNTGVEDANVLKRQFYEATTVNADGNTVTNLVRQALSLAGDADDNIRNVDFAFDPTLGGSLTYDFGDLPDSTFGSTTPDYDATVLSSGARNRIGSLYLGSGVSSENDGKSSSDASADTLDDGVSVVGDAITTGEGGGAVDVTASGDGWLVGWMDFNGDGDFADVGERIIDQAVTTGTTTLSFDVPSDLDGGTATYYSRFRIYSAEPLLISATGPAMDQYFAPVTGEVEDYAFSLAVTAATVHSFEARSTAKGVSIEWKTSAEIGTIGFFLQRWDEPSQSFVQVNEKLLPALVLQQQGGSYSYLDDSASPGSTYSYKLEEIEAGGRRNSYGPYEVNTLWTDQAEPQQGRERAEVVPGFSRLANEPRGRASNQPDGSTIGEAGRSGKAKRRAARLAAAGRPPTQSAKGKPGQIIAGAKLGVEETGIHIVSFAELASQGGLAVDNNRGGKAGDWTRSLVLANLGQTVAFTDSADGSGAVFYGKALDSIYTTDNVYWMGVTSKAGTRMSTRKETAKSSPSGNQTFTRSVHVEQDVYFGDSVYNDPERDTWIWDFLFAEPGYGSSLNLPFRADGATATGAQATLHIRLTGASDTPANPDHRAVAKINGRRVGEVSWNGSASVEAHLSFDSSALLDGDNVLELSAETEAPYSYFFLDSFDVDYPSRYRAYGNRIECSANGNAVLLVDGFTRPDVTILDVTDPTRPVLVTTTVSRQPNGSYGFLLSPPSANTVYAAATPDAMLPVPAITPDVASSLASSDNRGEYLIITTADLKASAQTLADYRGDLGSQVIDIQDVYDEFNYGIPSPHALKDFLEHAWSTWAAPPRYVVLAGDGSTDYRDILGLGENLVPTMRVSTPNKLAPSDIWFGDVDPSQPGPEIAIGRLPAANSAELDHMIGKIQAHEASLGSPWRNRVLLAADQADQAGDFSAGSDRVATRLASAEVSRIDLDADPIGPARTKLFQALDEGTGFVNFIGHGGYDLLAKQGLLTSGDVWGLTNLDQPVMTAVTCLAAHFALPGFPSMGEGLLRQNSGGAVAVWGATGLSQNNFAVSLAENFYSVVFSGDQVRIGDAINESYRRYGMVRGPAYLPETYALLGDPAMWVR